LDARRISLRFKFFDYIHLFETLKKRSPAASAAAYQQAADAQKCGISLPSLSADGRLHPVTTGSNLAAEPNGGNSASNWKERLRAAWPLLPVEEIGSGHSP